MSKVTLEFEPPTSVNFLRLKNVNVGPGEASVDVGRLTEDELEDAADMIRDAFIVNARFRRGALKEKDKDNG